MKKIVTEEGFDKLSFKQQVEVLNTKGNIMGLGKRTNASKGANSWSEWKGHSKLGPVPAHVQKVMMQREAAGRLAVQQAIAERLGNGN
jgi:hypothetical protein